MKINPLIFRAYDIRGIADPTVTDSTTPADLTEETAYLIGKGTGTYLRRKYDTKNMAVGRDNRLTGETLQKAFMKGVTETGIEVTDIGLAVSPMTYWASSAPCKEDGTPFDSATNITASHNPKEYNGIKTVANNAHSICGDELQEVLKIIQNEDFVAVQNPPAIKHSDIKTAHLDDIAARVKIARPLKIVVDAGNGVAGIFAPELLRKLGCEVVELYCDLDGNFPNHEANPEELKNMEDLIAKVQEENADLGIGFDGDGDRIGIVDETGHMYSSDFVLLLLVRELIKKNPHPKVVFDVKFSQAIINEMKKLGAETIMSAVGHGFIVNKLREENAPIAGEVSGHIYFGDDYYEFDDALLGAAKVLEALSNQDKPFSKLFDNMPKMYTTPEFKAATPDDKKFEIVKKLVEHFTNTEYNCITIDGVRVTFDKNSWGAVRASNTSPNLTLRFESDSPERLKEIQEIMVTELRKYPEVSLDWYNTAA